MEHSPKIVNLMAKNPMRFPRTFLTATAVFQGYLLWATTGVGTLWMIRAIPVSSPELAIRWACLPIIIALLIAANFLFIQRTNEKAWSSNFLRSVLSFNFVFIISTFLSDALNWFFTGSTDFYLTHLGIFGLELVILNILGFVVLITLGLVFVLAGKVIPNSSKFE